ncbi:urea ABC transporter permease subunit UrtC [Nocardioides sp. Kera G14]|uniref:urea ABC transporter permease subunit UrtC n=1 Tax=Nocardioides sp. Kera G14 TaxID=2884264 RepID=UPI001D1180D3|nr:urea ABC transporter permease subunit UrtC [Nocardioides sp. Kera G14]UDY25216.1 urea ABC transporter permease subunit UrtC [Nocardioides sp. Kera G14]
MNTSKAIRMLRGPWGSLLGIAVVALLLLVVAPGVLSEFRLNNLAKYCAWAMVAVGIGLAWGRGGMLVMGQGVFFGLGAYAMGMHMQLEASGGAVPSFMILYDPLAPLPSFWEPFKSGLFTIVAIVVAPIIVASILGYAIFKRRVKGAYFAILTQALAVALATLITSTIKLTGGDTGLSGFTSFFGYKLDDPANRQFIYTITAGLLIACLVVAWQLYRSRFGELLVATRDAEERVRFLGYDPSNIKLVAFVVAAVMASLGGAMFVPIAGIISPKDIDAAASILMIAGAALGGRAALFGPALGAIAVGYGQSTLSERWPDLWIYFLGGLFIVVTLFLPGGIASLPKLFNRFVRSKEATA